MVLTNIPLHKVSNFHGHICPDLVIGCRASQLALNLLNQDPKDQLTLTVVAENNTSAIDAIQCLTGCTLGNQYLLIRDFGKHKYTFIVNQTGQAVILSLNRVNFRKEKNYLALEKRLMNNLATIEDMTRIKVLLDQWVSWLFSLSDQELFSVDQTKAKPPDIALSSKYVTCHYCNDLVEETKAIKLHGNFLCQPCYRVFSYQPENVVWQ